MRVPIANRPHGQPRRGEMAKRRKRKMLGKIVKSKGNVCLLEGEGTHPWRVVIVTGNNAHVIASERDAIKARQAFGRIAGVESEA